VEAAGRQLQRGPRGDAHEPAAGVEGVEQREEVLLARGAAVQQHQRALRVAVRRPDAVSEVVERGHDQRDGTVSA
jgi:hypothetical protein